MIPLSWSIQSSATDGDPSRPLVRVTASDHGSEAAATPWDEDTPLSSAGDGRSAGNRTDLADPLTERDQEDFADLVRRCSGDLLRHLCRLCGQEQDAEDLLQETFLRAWAYRSALRDPRTERGWLFKIADNLFHRQYRDGLRRRAGPVQPLREDLLARDDEPPWSDSVLRALAELQEEDRRIVLLTGVHGYKLAEAAALIGCATATGKKRWQRAKARLAAGIRRIEANQDSRGTGRQAGLAGRKDGSR